MSKISYINFRERKKTPGGFNVRPDLDKNTLFEESLAEINQLYAERKFDEPPGQDCPKDEDIIALAHFQGIFFRGRKGEFMAKVLSHTEHCERCDALYFKTLIEKKMSKSK